MKKLVLLLLVVSFVGFASADTLRYMQNGPWETLATPDGSGGWIGPGWQSLDAPDATDTVRANWGGATITLDYETTVAAFQAGVDESGTFHIQNGGILNAGNSKVGNNGACTGTLIIDAGGTVNATGGWLMVAGNSTVTGVADVSGTLSSSGHLWAATGTGSTAIIDINTGGVVNINGMLGLGTINAVDPSGGIATLNVNDGGLLNLAQIHGGIMDDTGGTYSIQAGSSLQLFGSGIVTKTDNFVAVLEEYAAEGLIFGNGVAGNVAVSYDSGTNLTTVAVVPEPASMALFGLGALALLRKKK